MALTIKLNESTTPSMVFIIYSLMGYQIIDGVKHSIYGGNTVGRKQLPYNKSFTDAQELVDYARKLVGATKDTGVTITFEKRSATSVELYIVRETPDRTYKDIFLIFAKKQEDASADEMASAFENVGIAEV